MAIKYLDAKRIRGSVGAGTNAGTPNSEGTTPTVDSTNTAIYGANSLVYDGANDGNNTQSASAVLPSGFTKCTISCWLRANEFNNDYAVILKGNPDINDNDWVGIQAVSGGFKATVGSDSGSQVSCTSSGVSADEWHLVVLIYDGTESSSNDRLKLYVDDDAVVQPSSLSITPSVGSLTIEEGLGLTGISATFSVGSISLTDITIGLDSFEATLSVGAVDIFAYGDVDTGSNTSYSNVSTGSNDSYSDVATGSNTSYSDAA